MSINLSYIEDTGEKLRVLQKQSSGGVLRTFATFTGKHLCQRLFFNKVVGLGLQLYHKRVSGTGIFL